MQNTLKTDGAPVHTSHTAASQPAHRAPASTIRWMKSGLRCLTLVSPVIAGHAAYRIFATPQRIKVPVRETETLANARRIAIPFGQRKELSGYQWGDSGPLVLLVHGWDSRASQLGTLLDPLRKAEFRVLSYDAPAHGRSPGNASDFADMCDAFRATVKYAGPVHGIIAHSLGAACVSAGLQDYEGPCPRIAYLAPVAWPSGTVSKFVSILEIAPEVAERMRAHIVKRRGADVFERFEIERQQRELKPLLILHDRADRDVSIEESEAIVRAWPSAQLVRLDRRLSHRNILRDAEVIERATAFVTAAAPTATV